MTTQQTLTSTEVQNLQDRSVVWKTVRPFLVGGASAASATCCIQPIDMVKVRIQLMEGKGTPANPLKVASLIVRENGIPGFYRGLSAAVFRQLTYGLSRLGIYRTLSTRFTPEGKKASDIPFGTRVACSLIAGGTGALIGTPGDAALVRMQADTVLPASQRRGYTNVFNALTRMAREEGMKGFFTGASPTILRGLFMNVGMLTSYDKFKAMTGGYLGGIDSQATRFVSGFLSGWLAATMSLPADFIKTRLQKQVKLADGSMPYKGVFDCIVKVTRQEGVLAFYKGYPTFVARITPHIMLTWVFMDNVQAMLKNKNM